MSRFPSHVMVYDEESQVHEPMTLEDFAALFTYGQTITRDQHGLTVAMSHDILVKERGPDSESGGRNG